MKKIICALFCLMFSAVLSVAAQTEQCFKSEGLKQLQTVKLTVTGNRVKGTFEVSGYDESTPARTVEFTGTRTGNRLAIEFQGTPPYELPPRTKKIVWTLGRTGLKIPTYGKNYDTNKFSGYTSTFEKCRDK